ncbi:MAG: PspA/IM30 family protein [Nitrospirae bacterium]|nr:PspA/IM30 family protein [Nitrospirota bacterium]
MAGIFERLFKLGQSEANTLVDKLEDPIKMTEQGIRDLKNDLESAMRSLAEVKASAIRLKKEGDEQKAMAADYERKAMLLLQKAQEGSLTQAEAERLAEEALLRKKECEDRSNSVLSEYQNEQQMADKLQANVTKLKSTISSYENELITLKAREKTAISTKKINQQLSSMDSSGTIAMLEKMKQKVAEEESLATAYGEMAETPKSVDAEIDKALEKKPDVSESLAALKAKMGINK